MTETKNTEHLTKLVDLALTGVDVAKKALADGHVGLEDLGLLIALVPAVGPAIDGIGEVPAELKDLSADEAQALAAHVMAKLVVEDAKARAIVEASLGMVAASLKLAAAIKMQPAPAAAPTA